MRSTTLPVTAAMASAYSFSTSASVQDIVLNSCAAPFTASLHSRWPLACARLCSAGHCGAGGGISRPHHHLPTRRCAIGFVFELDDLLYQRLLTTGDKREHETTPPKAGSPLTVRNSPYIVT